MAAELQHEPDPPGRASSEAWADAGILGALLGFLLFHLRPDLLLESTTPTGGDMVSHYATAVYFRDHLLPSWQLSGWAPGNYAGFPVLQFYFPLAFLVMVLLSGVCALPIAFKWTSLLGTLGLPVAAYTLMRCLGYRFPIPILAALATPVFLFQEGNSMWGGNILSTLAGEFAYSLGMSLALVFLGTAWRGVQTGSGLALNAGLLALVGLAHGYTLLFAGLTSLGLIALAPDRWAAIRYLASVYGLAFTLLGVWILPLLLNLPFTTVFAPAWFIKELTEVLPLELVPMVGVAVLWSLWLGFARLLRGRPIDRPALYLWYGIGISAAGYLLGPWLGIVDVRFIPFGQIFLVLLGAIAVGQLLSRIRWGWAVSLGLVAVLSIWTVEQARQIPGWLAWNYAGAERTPLWSAFAGVNRVLAGDANDPRVVYEHSMVHNGAGTPRAFEALPLFSGRSTLEGLYLQATPSAPFVFYTQAELSKEASCPFTHLACAHFNLNHAIPHLRLFHVREIVAVSDQLKQGLRRREDVERIAEIAPYEIYRLRDTEAGGYVEPLRFEPVLVTDRSWKEAAYQWFRKVDQLEVTLVFPTRAGEPQLDRFSLRDPQDLGRLPRRPIHLPDLGPVRTRMSNQSLEFDTPYIGLPHLVKVSYHPNWRVEGADVIYPAAPSFMLVFPEQRQVRLTYGWRWPEWLGGFLTGATLVALPVLQLRRRKVPEAVFRPLTEPRTGWRQALCGGASGSLPLVLLGLAVALHWSHPSPYVLLNEGIQARDRKDFSKASALLGRVIDRIPTSGAAEQAAYYLGTIAYIQNDMDATITQFRAMIDAYPSSPFVPEAYYHIGLAHQRNNRPAEARQTFDHVVTLFPASAWAGFARARLAELHDPPTTTTVPPPAPPSDG